MKTLKNIIASAAVALVLGSCSDWTVPEHLEFYPQSPEEADPAAYAEYLTALKAYKASEHNIMIVGMEGTSSWPSSQNQHLMAMPDSADYICLRMPAEGLNEEIAKEIPMVKEKKGTKSLLFVDYAMINDAWNLLQDEKSDKGEPAGTDEEAKAFFTAQAEAQLAACTKYSFDGLYVSYQGNANSDFGKLTQEAYMGAVKAFTAANSGLEIIFRGSARNIQDKTFFEQCRYISIVADTEKKLTNLVGRILGYDQAVPKDRILMELTVPSVDDPVQKGSSPAEGAQWVLDEKESTSFTPRGLCVYNAHDDYFQKDLAFKNVRQAISIMNPQQ